MKPIYGLVMALSVAGSAYAQGCLRPGEVFSRDFLKVEGDTVSQSFQRAGSSQILSSASFTGNISARTYRVYREDVCVTKTRIVTEKVCLEVNPDLALGRGNSTVKFIFDLNQTLMRRSQEFANSVKYQVTDYESTRLLVATEIVKNISRLAATEGIPNSWEAFESMLRETMNSGLITYSVFEDITVYNAGSNKRALGYLRAEGVQIVEGRGHESFRKVFDLSLSPQRRANLLNQLLVGIEKYQADKLSRSFVQFAATHGTPDSWNQFTLMMKLAVQNGDITERVYRNVVIDYELKNRKNLGFELTATQCHMENRTVQYNDIEVRQTRDFLKTVSKNFRVDISNAPLLQGEREEFSVLYDGVSAISVRFPHQYNAYRTLNVKEENSVEVIKIEGSRKQVDLPNTLSGHVTSHNGVLGIELHNNNSNSNSHGRVFVKVEYIQVRKFWLDKSLGEELYELGGVSKKFSSKLKTKKDSEYYAKVSMKIEGSPYYNSSYTREIEIK